MVLLFAFNQRNCSFSATTPSFELFHPGMARLLQVLGLSLMLQLKIFGLGLGHLPTQQQQQQQQQPKVDLREQEAHPVDPSSFCPSCSLNPGAGCSFNPGTGCFNSRSGCPFGTGSSCSFDSGSSCSFIAEEERAGGEVDTAVAAAAAGVAVAEFHLPFVAEPTIPALSVDSENDFVIPLLLLLKGISLFEPFYMHLRRRTPHLWEPPQRGSRHLPSIPWCTRRRKNRLDSAFFKSLAVHPETAPLVDFIPDPEAPTMKTRRFYVLTRAPIAQNKRTLINWCMLIHSLDVYMMKYRGMDLSKDSKLFAQAHADYGTCSNKARFNKHWYKKRNKAINGPNSPLDPFNNPEHFVWCAMENIMTKWATHRCLEPSSIIKEDFETGVFFSEGQFVGIEYIQLKPNYNGQKKRSLSLKNPVLDDRNTKKTTPLYPYNGDPMSTYQTTIKLLSLVPDNCEGVNRIFCKLASKKQKEARFSNQFALLFSLSLQIWKKEGCSWRLNPTKANQVIGKSKKSTFFFVLFATWSGYDNPERCTAHGKRHESISKVTNAGVSASLIKGLGAPVPAPAPPSPASSAEESQVPALFLDESPTVSIQHSFGDHSNESVSSDFLKESPPALDSNISFATGEEPSPVLMPFTDPRCNLDWCRDYRDVPPSKPLIDRNMRIILASPDTNVLKNVLMNPETNVLANPNTNKNLTNVLANPNMIALENTNTIILVNRNTTRITAADTRTATVKLLAPRIASYDTSHHAPHILSLMSRDMSAIHHLVKNLAICSPLVKFHPTSRDMRSPNTRNASWHRAIHTSRDMRSKNHHVTPRSQAFPTPPQDPHHVSFGDNQYYYPYEEQNGAWGPSPMEKKVTKKMKPTLFTARLRKKMGVVVSPSLLDHILNDAACYSYYKRSSGKSQDATQQSGLLNTRNGPQSSVGALPEVLDNQVMFNPSVEPIGRALIGRELTNIEDDNDTDEDEGSESTEAPHSLSVNDEEGNGIEGDGSHRDTNMEIMMPSARRHVSDELMVKIKLMKIMRNHSIPLVAEKELYEWAIESEHLHLFSWMKGNNLVQMRSRVMSDISATVPEIKGDGFEPHLIDWCSKKSTTSDVPVCKEIYVWSFQKALHSLLTNVTLVKEENLSFPHAEDPTLLVRSPELQGHIDIDELHHGEWWINIWGKRCRRDLNEILVPIILYMDGITIDNSGQSNKLIDNVYNLHSGLHCALSSLKDAFTYFIGDTPQHNQLCGHYQTANTKMICRHCNCPRAHGNNSCVNVMKIPVSIESGNMHVSNHKSGEEYQSVWLWKMSDFTSSTVGGGVNVEQYFKNVSHHRVHNGNAFHDLDFGENPHNIHLASPGERLHMHQLGCTKRATETFREDFLGNNTRLLGEMDRIVSYYGGAVQMQSKRDFPRTNFSESIHTAKKVGNQYIGMLYIQMLALLSAEGCQLLLFPRTTTNLENRSQKCEEEIDERIYTLELLLGMEEFLKYAGTFDEVLKEDNKGVLNLDKMVVHFINCINNYLHQSKGEGNNLYMRLFGPPMGWDSAASESNHKSEVKAPAKRTQQIKSMLIKQTCKQVMEYYTIDWLDREFDLFHHKSFTGASHPTEGGRGMKRKTHWFPSDVLKFCCNVVLPAAATNTLCGSTEHKRYDKYRRMGFGLSTLVDVHWDNNNWQPSADKSASI
eukprot:jgi/Psemu1/15691/gm1.15691_g